MLIMRERTPHSEALTAKVRSVKAPPVDCEDPLATPKESLLGRPRPGTEWRLRVGPSLEGLARPSGFRS